ncbi:DNA-binding Lrp family transcriptional regulator [Sphingomonas kyeonggiensis]|uniref:DNA-binding Lrp family transcriptional regulator n=1 Tax=Sphingomonas kyeonggiensis TaxID=1268553 RepID=A0A7W7JYA5_9SPHN|nr:Lrp/AsnC family transcriptional regulator [Sphingomonas kyeonggiensis]MBB4837584.1 DNA-binding Lrp family transcriptional regulator [Sphingomonas kyeonggiensis]
MTNDDMDLRILALLQEDALMTADLLAEKLPLSPSAIARRIRRMRADGTIAADVSIVSEEVGPFLSALVHVQFDRHSLDALQGLQRRLIASPHVQLVAEVTGSFDLVLVVSARDMDAFNALVDSLLGNDPVVRRYETSFFKRRRKFTPALPLHELLGD